MGRKKFVTLAYAENLELVAKTEKKMKEALKRFKVYVEKKKL